MPANRSGATSGAQIVGLKEFRAELKAASGAWAKELAAAHRTVAQRGADWAKWEAVGSGNRMQAAASPAIKGVGTQRDARIRINQSPRIPFANPAFWGAKKRTGWYGRSRYSESATPQFPEWVGNTWDVGIAGQGPYAINDALAKHMDDLLDTYWELVDEVARRAFPT